jgi:hypothetical protein
MSTVADIQPQNQLSKFIGTGEFSFAEGYVTAAAALGKPFMDFGNIDVMQYEANSQSKVLISSRRGLRVEETSRITLLRMGYKLTCNEARAELINYLVSGDMGVLGLLTQTIQAAVATDAISTPVNNRWYDLTKTGVQYRNLTAVAIVSTPSVVEDVDYKIDYENGRLRWITTPPGTITSISITCPAIISSQTGLALVRMNPKVTPIRRGIARLQTYDRAPGAAQYTAYLHRDFYCEVMASGTPKADGQNELTIEVDVKVLTPAGEVQVREQAIYSS